MNRHIESGNGWRLGWNPEATEYCALVASDRWSLELTATEFADFCRCTRQLSQTMQDMAEHLMDEERLSCEKETAHIWLEAEGFPNRYSLRFILSAGRRGEGEWTSEQTRELVEALRRAPFLEIGTEATQEES